MITPIQVGQSELCKYCSLNVGPLAFNHLKGDFMGKPPGTPNCNTQWCIGKNGLRETSNQMPCQRPTAGDSVPLV